jgi:hypothetical protein
VKNVLLEKVEYQVTETSFGAWRRFLYPNGQLFEEFVSHTWVMGLPLVHFTRGKCPETGRRIVAKGVVAIGRLAVGVVAIGHASTGVVAVGQASFGLLLGMGQATFGVCAVGQLALGVAFGLGQFVTGYVAVGQIALGAYVLAQVGTGLHVWDSRGSAPAAVQFFRSLIP